MGKWQEYKKSLWPVESWERKKLYPLAMMMVLICFNYTLLRNLKDVFVLEDMDGPEPILWLKTFFVLPVSIIYMLLYSKLAGMLSKTRLFYTFLFSFVFIFGLYGFVLLPNRELVEPSDEWFQSYAKRDGFPKFLIPPLKVLRFWTTSYFYIFAEMWGTICLSLLFWSFANDICRISEAKRFYPLINLGANCALTLCGTFVFVMTLTGGKEPEKQKGRKADHTISYLMIAAVEIIALIVGYLYYWMQKNVLTDPRLYDPTAGVPKKQKKKVGMVEGLKTVFTSSYIGCIALMVVFYGMSVNFIEIYYKGAFGSLYTDKKDKLRVTGILSFLTGVIAIPLLLFCGTKFIDKFGWTKTALLTPVVLSIFGMPFMLMEFFQLQNWFTARELSVVFGTIAVACSKSFKYSFFDPTKEMAYIPLDDNMKLRGKAAVDVVGARLGKSGSGLIQIIFMIAMDKSSRFDYLHILIGMLVVGVLSWLFGTITLGRKFNRLMAQREVEASPNEKVQEKGPQQA